MDKKKLDTYLQEARSWDADAARKDKKMNRICLAAAAVGVAFGFLGMSMAYVQYNKPLPMPVVIWGDKAAGRVDQVQYLAEGKITVPEVTDKYFAWQYVLYRETWSPDLAAEYRYRTALMSTDAEQQRYDTFYRQSDKSPRKLYGDSGRARPEYRGASVVAPGVLAVRYALTVERAGMPAETSLRTATVTFAYSSGRMSERDRAINPLGFQASDYRTDPDVLEAPRVAAAPSPVPAPPAAPAPVAPVAAPLDLRPLQARGQ